MRKHPILLGLGILTSIFLAFLAVVFIFAWLMGGEKSLPYGDKVGVVEITGLIVDSQETIKQLSVFRDNSQIKAIVIRVDSPGGVVGATQEIYSEIKKTGLKKPVVASCSSIATSGGYYVALGARKILINPGTITGSIGVIMKFANAEELLHKIGVKTSVLKSGALKDIGSVTREMTPKEKSLIQGVIDDVHGQFVKTVSEERKLPMSKVARLADGRIFSGNQAYSLGLVDKLGNIEDAILMAAQMGGIKEKPQTVYARKKRVSFLDIITGSEAAQSIQGLFYSPYKLFFATN